jgi:hypothetical protein
VWGCNTGENKNFVTSPKRPRGSHSLLQNDCRVTFSGVKQPRRGVKHLPLSSTEIKERVYIYSYIYILLYIYSYIYIYTLIYIYLLPTLEFMAGCRKNFTLPVGYRSYWQSSAHIAKHSHLKSFEMDWCPVILSPAEWGTLVWRRFRSSLTQKKRNMCMILPKELSMLLILKKVTSLPLHSRKWLCHFKLVRS